MAVEVPNPFEWNSAWDKEDEETNKNNKEAFELVKKVDENREDADAKKALVDCLAKCEKAKEMHEALSGDDATITDEIMAKIKTWLVEQITA